MDLESDTLLVSGIVSFSDALISGRDKIRVPAGEGDPREIGREEIVSWWVAGAVQRDRSHFIERAPV